MPQIPKRLETKHRFLLLITIIAVVLAFAAWSGTRIPLLPTSASQTGEASCQGLPGCSYSATETCYLDGCVPVACPGGLCGGGIVTTTISAHAHSTQTAQTLVGTVKVIQGSTPGTYFFDVGSVQYHLIFCNCPQNSTCNCPNIPVLNDGQQLQVTGTIVTPSTYGPVWAPGGDIYVQKWSLV